MALSRDVESTLKLCLSDAGWSGRISPFSSQPPGGPLVGQFLRAAEFADRFRFSAQGLQRFRQLKVRG